MRLLTNSTRSFLIIKTKYTFRQAGRSPVMNLILTSCEPVCLTYYCEFITLQQHSSLVQLGHSVLDLLLLQSSGKQPQSAHLIGMIL